MQQYTLVRAPGGVPLLGHIPQLVSRPLHLFQSIRKLGDVVVIRMGTTPCHVVNHPALIREVLVVEAKKFDKGRQFEKARPYVGNGIATSSEPLHLRQRRLMQPAFHQAQIAHYTESMRRVAQGTIDAWPRGVPIALERELLCFTIRALTDTLFSTEADANVVAAVTESLPLLLSGIAWRVAIPFEFLEKLPTRANRRFEAGRLRLRATIDQLVAGHREEPVLRNDLVSMLLGARDPETGAGMTDEQVRDEIMTMMLAGSETTASTLGWVCHLLSEHPTVQQRVQAEVDAVLGTRPVTTEDLPRLVYLRQVICEALRLYPPAWLASRRAIEDVVIGGHTIPAGGDVFFSAYGVHRDPSIYSQPDSFDPDRWSGETMKSMSRPTFLAFGSGPRGCIGDGFAWSEMLVFLSTLLQACILCTPRDQRVRVLARGLLRADGLGMILGDRTLAAGG